jgi:hypothetical protein
LTAKQTNPQQGYLIIIIALARPTGLLLPTSILKGWIIAMMKSLGISGRRLLALGALLSIRWRRESPWALASLNMKKNGKQGDI